MAYTVGTSATIPASGTSTSNPVSGSYTCDSGSTALVVMLFYAGSTARGGGAPTYNDVSLTQADQQRFGTSGPEASVELWYLLDPPTGTSYTLSIPNTGGLALVSHVITAIATSGYTSALDAATGVGGVSDNPAHSITTTVAGDIIFGAVANGAQSWSPTARTGTQITDGDYGSWGGGSQYFVKSNTGAQTISWSFATNPDEDWGIVLLALKEVIAARTVLIKSATITSSGPISDIIPGSVTKTVNNGVTTLNGPSLTVISITSTTVQLSSAAVTTLAQTLDVVPGETIIALSAGLIASSGNQTTLVPGAVSVALNNAILEATGPTLSVPVLVQLSSGTISGLGQTVTISGATIIYMRTGTLTGYAPTITREVGGVSILCTSGTLSTSCPQLSVLPGTVTISLVTGILALTGTQSVVVPGTATLMLSQGNIFTTGQTITVVTGAATVLCSYGLIAISSGIIVVTPSTPDGYELQRQDDGGEWFTLVTGLQSTNYQDTYNLINGVEYCYRVRPWTSGTPDEWSVTDCVVYYGSTSIGLSSGIVTSSGGQLTVVPGTSTIALYSASIITGGNVLTISTGASAVSLYTAFITATGNTLVVLPGQKQILLTGAYLTVVGQELQVVPGMRSVVLNSATTLLSGRTIQITSTYDVLLKAAQIAISGQAISMLPGTATVLINQALITLQGNTLFIIRDIQISLAYGALLVGEQQLSIVPGWVTIVSHTASLATSGQALAVIPGSASTALDSGLLSFDGPVIDVIHIQGEVPVEIILLALISTMVLSIDTRIATSLTEDLPLSSGFHLKTNVPISTNFQAATSVSGNIYTEVDA